MTIEHLGFIRSDLPDLKQWCRDQQLTERPSTSSYAPGRFEKWFEFECKLSTIVEVITAPHDERIYRLGQRLFPGNNCCLFLHYFSGVGILPHRDHTASLAWVVSVNIGARVTFRHGSEIHYLDDGQVVGFDSKIAHSLDPVESERWALSWRRIKPKYLHPQQALF